jgi:hypothetical protein
VSVLDSVLTRSDGRISMSQLWRSRLATLGWVLASGPAAFLAILLLHALHVRAYLGRWPVVYRDDPQTLLLQIHEYGLLVPALWGSLFGVPLWLLSGAILAATGLLRWRVFRGQLWLILAGIAAVMLLAKLDPTGYVEWFLD